MNQWSVTELRVQVVVHSLPYLLSLSLLLYEFYGCLFYFFFCETSPSWRFHFFLWQSFGNFIVIRNLFSKSFYYFYGTFFLSVNTLTPSPFWHVPCQMSRKRKQGGQVGCFQAHFSDILKWSYTLSLSLLLFGRVLHHVFIAVVLFPFPMSSFVLGIGWFRVEVRKKNAGEFSKERKIIEIDLFFFLSLSLTVSKLKYNLNWSEQRRQRASEVEMVIEDNLGLAANRGGLLRLTRSH